MSIVTRSLEIAVAGQAVEAFLYGMTDARGPGILLYTDIKGIREVYHEQAMRLAEAGYAVLVPNVFFRWGRLPLFDFPFRPGEERTAKRLQELFAALTPEMQMADSAAYVDFLLGQKEVRAGSLGVVGYCYTGGMALRTAAVRADQVSVAASFHGGNLCTEQESSPHRLLPKIRASLWAGHAVEDKSMPPEMIAKLDEALRAWGGEFTSKVYEGALHGWTNRDSPIYNEAQATAAFRDLLGELKRL